MKKTMYEITYLQTQLLALDMLKAKVSAELSEVFANTDMEKVQEIINNDELMKGEYQFTDNDQCEAICEVTGKALTFEEFKKEILEGFDERFN